MRATTTKWNEGMTCLFFCVKSFIRNLTFVLLDNKFSAFYGI